MVVSRTPNTFILWLLALVTSVTALCSAILAEPKMHLEVSPQSGNMGDAYMFSVVIEGEAETSYPFLVGGDDFRLSLIGPETNVEVVNGNVSRRIAYRYQLLPKRAGELDSPSAEIEIDGIKMHVPPIKIAVSDKGKSSITTDEELFIRQDVPTTEVYIGEQLPYALELYTSVQVLNPQLQSLSFDGFWNEDIGQDSDLSRVINGKRYNLTAVRKSLFALRSGEIVLPQQRVRLQVRERNKRTGPFDFPGADPFDNSILDDFFGRGRFRDLELASDPLPIKVKPLPQAPMALSSWGALLVGRTSLDLALDSSPMKVGESRTGELVISSFGNTNAIKKIPFPQDPRFKFYQEAPTTERHKEAGKIRFEKRFRFSIIPLEPGDIEIPPFELSYFDPESAQYKALKPPSLKISVSGLAAGKKQPSSSAQPQGSIATPKITPLDTPSLTDKPAIMEQLGISKQLAALIGFISLGLLATIILAVKLFIKGAPLRRMRCLINEARDAGQLQSAYREFLQMHYKLSQDLNSDEIRIQLTKARYPGELIFEITSIQAELNSLVYGSAPGSDLSAIRARILSLI